MIDYYTLYDSKVKGIKPGSSPNQYAGFCPFHEDRKKRSFSFNSETGLFHCFAGCESGNAYQFAERIGTDPKPYGTYPQTETEPIIISKIQKNGDVGQTKHSVLNKSDKTKAFSNHKYLLENFAELTKGLNWSIEVVKKTFTGYDPEKKRFTFLHFENGEAVNIKYHKGKNGEHPFSVRAGFGKCRLFPENLLEEYKSDLPLIFCEGEKDVITLLSVFDNYQPITSTTGADSYPDLSLLKRFKTIYILYDNDRAGNTGGKKLGEALKKQSPKSKIIVTHWKETPEKWDITDHFSQDKDKLDLIDELDEVLAGGKEIVIKKRGYSIMKAEQFKRLNFKKPIPIVEEILIEKGYGTIAGSDGVGKSFLALQFGISCALGVPFLEYKTSKDYKVLLVQFELENGELLHRFNRMMNWFNSTYPNTSGNINNLFLSTLEADTLIFSNQWEQIEATLKESETKFEILIVDNLYTSTNVDVSNPHQLSPLLGEITRIAKENNLAVMLVNHHTKKTAEIKRLDKDMIRGGKNFTDWLTNSIQLGESSLSQDWRVFKITKQRSGNGFTNGIPQALKWDTDNLVFHRIGTIEREELHFIDPKTKPEFDSIRKVEPYAKDNIFTTGQYKPVVEEMGYSEKTGFNWLNKLERWKVIKKEGYGNYRILKSELDNYGEKTA